MTKDEAWLLSEKYNGVETPDFKTDCERLTAGEPLAYVIGWVPFLDTKIHLDTHPLIPRTETEFWVEQAIADIKSYGGPASVRVLDLCAGSGCIGVAILKNVPNASVDFAEIDESHHTTIEKNLVENSIELSRAKILGGNLFEQIQDTYDFILTNPPYIDPEVDRIEKSVREHEPDIALYGGNQGMVLIEQIIETAPNFLIPKSTLYIEHEPEQSERISEKGKEYNFSVTTKKDQYGVQRFTRLSRGE